MKTIKQYPLLSIFLFSLLWNCIIVFTIPEIHVSSDSDDYLALAKSLSDHGSFMFNNQYETLRTPGYPFFLYIVQKAVGSGNCRLIALIQGLLSSLTAVMVFAISRKWFDLRAAWLSALMYIFNPGTWLGITNILSENLFIFVLVAIIFVMTFYNHRNFVQFSIGLMMGMLCLIRPVAASFWVLYTVVLLFTFRPFRKGLTYIVVFIIGILLTQEAWNLRNYIHYQQFYLTEISTYYLYAYAAQDIVAMRSGGDFEQLNQQAVVRFAEARKVCTPQQMQERFTREAKELIGNDFRFIPVMMRNGALREITDTAVMRWIERYCASLPVTVNKMISLIKERRNWKSFCPAALMLFLRLSEMISIVMVFLGALFTAIFAWKNKSFPCNRRDLFYLSWSIILCLFLISAGPSANYRMREQYMVLLLIWTVPTFLYFYDWIYHKIYISKP